VEYLLVGGWAVTFYGNPRLTGDIDFLISSKNDNIDKLKKAMDDFNAPSFDMEEFKKEKESFIRMGVSPIQIDVIKQAAGIIMEECFKRKETIDFNGLKINVISLKDLITNKRAAGRDKDIMDANKLEGLLKVNSNEYISIIQEKQSDKQKN